MITKDYGTLKSERTYQRKEVLAKPIKSLNFSCTCTKGVINGNEVTFFINTGKANGNRLKGKQIDCIVDYTDDTSELYKIKYMVFNEKW